MAIPIQFIPEIPEDKLSSSVRTKLNSGDGGSSNPSIRIATTQAHLTTALTGSEKEINIQGNITLTSNITIAANAKLSYGGGIIDVGNYEVTFVNNDLSDSKWDFQTGRINSNSTFKKTNINIADFGIVADGDYDAGIGTDNRNVLLQCNKIWNYTGKKAVLDVDGVVYMSVVEPELYDGIPKNLWITGKSQVEIASNTILKILPNDLVRYDVFTLYDIEEGGGLIGQGELIGDWKHHDFTNGDSEKCFGVVPKSGVKGVIGLNKISEFPGDPLCGEFNPNLFGSNLIVESFFTKNYTIDETGAFVDNDAFAYSQFVDVTNVNYTKFGISLGAAGFSGKFGLDVHQYYMAFYDASETFLGITDLVDTFRNIPKPTNCTKIRVVIYQPSDWSALIGSIMAPNHLHGLEITTKTLSYAGRDGASNLPPFTTVIGTTFEFNGYRENGYRPEQGSSYGLNNEDGFQQLKNIRFIRCTFKDNAIGDFVLKGSLDNSVENCFFPYNTSKDYKGGDINLEKGERTRLTSSLIQNSVLTLGRQSVASNNTIMDVEVAFSQRDEVFTQHYNARNVRFALMGGLEQGSDEAYILDNFIVYDKPLVSTSYVFSNINNLIFKRNIFDFQNKKFNNVNNKLSSQTLDDVSRGLLEDNIFRGITPENTQEHTLGFNLPYMNMKGNVFESNIGINIRNGGVQDVVIENQTFNGWIHFYLPTFPNTDTGDFHTVTLKNCIININEPSFLDWGGTDAYAIWMAQKDINFKMIGGEINLNITTNANRFFNILINGTKYFESVKFKTNASLQTQTLDSSYELNSCKFTNINFAGATITP